MELVRPCNDHPNIYRTQFEPQPKIIQVTIIERVFIVRFHFKRNSAFVAIDFVCRSDVFITVTYDPRVKNFLAPTQTFEVLIQPAGDKRFASARRHDVTP